MVMSVVMNVDVFGDTSSVVFHVMVDNGLIYLCAADRDMGKRQPYAFLSEVIHWPVSCKYLSAESSHLLNMTDIHVTQLF